MCESFLVSMFTDFFLDVKSISIWIKIGSSPGLSALNRNTT